MRRHELDTGDNVPQHVIPGWGDEASLKDVLDAVVADKVVRDAVIGDADGLLDKAAVFERIRVHQRSDKRAFDVLGVVRRM